MLLIEDYLHPQDVNVVIYHKNCQDGLAAAACFYAIHGKSIDYIAMNYDEDIDSNLLTNLTGKNVAVVDLSFKLKDLKVLETVCNKIIIIDHHISALREYENLGGIISKGPTFVHAKNIWIDTLHSGASLAVTYTHDINGTSKFINYVEDRDLWKWQYKEESEPMYYALINLDRSAEHIDTIAYYSCLIFSDKLVDDLILTGTELIAENNKKVKELVKNMYIVNTTINGKGYKIACLKLYNPTKLISEIACYMYENNDVDFTVCYFSKFDEKTNSYKYVLSFRTDKKDIDVSEIAKLYGGGGHVKAAGATVNELPHYLVKNTYIKHLKIFNKHKNIILPIVFILVGLLFKITQ